MFDKKEYLKAYREANKEKLAEYSKAYKEANKEKIALEAKAYREANKEYFKAYREANKEKIALKKKAWREANKEKIKAWREANKEKLALKRKAYREANKEKLALKRKAYREANKEKCRESHTAYIRNRRKNDAVFKLENNLRNRVRNALKKDNAFKNERFCDLLGCTIAEAFTYIESLFTDGMNWSNIHIDHIRPCASFDLSKESERRKCFNYKNLAPLFAEDNLAKGAKYNGVDYSRR